MHPRAPTSTLFPYTTLFRSRENSSPTGDATTPRRPAMSPEQKRMTAGTARRIGGGIGSGSVSAHQNARPTVDRKSTRLNSSHRCISYAVFCLKKKKKKTYYK